MLRLIGTSPTSAAAGQEVPQLSHLLRSAA